MVWEVMECWGHPWMVLGTSMDGAEYPWDTSLVTSWPRQDLNQDTKGEE